MSATMTLQHEVCRASAGTGKTYQLTNRYLRLLRGGADPGAILATTFTRKAAGEILGRVFGRLTEVIQCDAARQRLEKEIGGPLTEDDYVRMLRRLVATLPRLSIGTLDSFFNRVAQCFALELSLPSGAQLCDERGPEAEQLTLEAIEAMLGDEEMDHLLPLLRRVHHDSATRTVTQSILTLIADFHTAYLDAPERAQWTRADLPGLLDDTALQRAIEDLAATELGIGDKRWVKAFGQLIESAQQRDWESVLCKGLGAKWPDGTFYSKPMPASLVEAMRSVIEHAVSDWHRRYADQTLAAHELLDKFNVHYERLRRQRGLMLFSDITRGLARRLPKLGDDVMLDVYYRLDGRVRHLLLDEFQDTDPEQWAILEPIAAEVTADLTSDRSFYCVGDVKQAIHGWRGGCVELFGHIEQTFSEAIVPVSMDRSQRSSQVILDAVNDVFQGLSGNTTLADHAEVAATWAAQFKQHNTAHPDRAGYVVLETAPPEDADDAAWDDGDDLGAGAPDFLRFVAEKVKALHLSAPARSIGVLVERNATVAALVSEMHRIGLRASGDGRSPIADVPAVAALLSLLTLADHPADRVCAFHVAHSPVGAMIGLTVERGDAVRRVAMDVRRRLLDAGYARTIADWTRKLAPSCDAAQFAGLEMLCQLAERYEPAATLRTTDFVRYVRGTDLDRGASAPVRVMTIHGSKGLTFDATVLAEMDRRMQLASKLLIDRDDPLSPVKSVFIAPKQTLRDRVPPLEAIAQKQARRELSEELCKLYVAMTRSRHGLYMYVKAKKKGAAKLTPGRIVVEALTGQPEPPDEAAVLYEKGDSDWMAHGRASAPTPPMPAPVSPIRLYLPVRERSWTSVSPSSLERGGRVSTADLLRVEPHGGQAYGSRIHELLSQIEFLDEASETPEELRNVLAHAAVRSALSRRDATAVWREQPFAVRDGDRLLRGTFDRVVFHDGGATIIDFKTDTVVDVERYRPQVEAYRRALSKLRGIEESKIRCKLLFVGSGEVVDV